MTQEPPTLVYKIGESWILDEPGGQLARYDNLEMAKYQASEPYKVFEERSEAAKFADHYEADELRQ